MSLPYRLGCNSLFTRPNEETKEPKRVVFLSAEGTSTEVCYFKYIERYREQLGIDAIVHVLLHVSDVKTEFSEQLGEILDNQVDEKDNSFVSNLLHAKTGQRKNIQAKTFEKHYLPNIDLAIERAKDFAPSGELLDQLGTNLGDLFTLLRA